MIDLLRELVNSPWWTFVAATPLILLAVNCVFIARNAVRLEARVTELERALEKEVAE